MGMDKVHLGGHRGSKLPKNVSSYGDLVGILMPVCTPMLNELQSPVHDAGGKNEFRENHAGLQGVTNDLPRRRLRGGQRRNLEVGDGVRSARRK